MGIDTHYTAVQTDGNEFRRTGLGGNDGFEYGLAAVLRSGSSTAGRYCDGVAVGCTGVAGGERQVYRRQHIIQRHRHLVNLGIGIDAAAERDLYLRQFVAQCNGLWIVSSSTAILSAPQQV